jgi:hypothetical protein
VDVTVRLLGTFGPRHGIAASNGHSRTAADRYAVARAPTERLGKPGTASYRSGFDADCWQEMLTPYDGPDAATLEH